MSALLGLVSHGNYGQIIFHWLGSKTIKPGKTIGEPIATQAVLKEVQELDGEL